MWPEGQERNRDRETERKSCEKKIETRDYVLVTSLVRCGFQYSGPHRADN